MRTRPTWRVLRSSATKASKSSQAEDDAWALDMLEQIVEVVRAGAPAPVQLTSPTIEELQPLNFEVPYEELLTLLTTLFSVVSWSTTWPSQASSNGNEIGPTMSKQYNNDWISGHKIIDIWAAYPDYSLV
ncbi:hypothetical protein AMS68_006486 [Peltaster fructicola]|uniref:Uncharacterized protein n=1 Tax=Peltaster fructicola TaxID=286661 RepID=A0A6H0Y275_9PEZI|nr:hypothetical protein AMS68_006486 [Peltaster fructicola]